MNSFEKLFVNSTNRISSIKNIVLSSQESTSITESHQNTHYPSVHNKNPSIKTSCAFDEPSETFEELQLRYQELSKTLKQANKQKSMMQDLFEMIFKVQQGEAQKMKKRIRRKKDQIQSKYYCTMSSCKKAYSSSASLLRHNKLKHAHAKLQPPSHNYNIPPSPNLNHSKVEKRPSDMKESLQKEGEYIEEEGAAYLVNNDEEFYEADCEHSQNSRDEFDES